MEVRAKKALGQHFLTDQGIARRIVETLSVAPTASTTTIPLHPQGTGGGHIDGRRMDLSDNQGFTQNRPLQKDQADLQNHLRDSALHSTAVCSNGSNSSPVLEIGPGMGVLTQYLLEREDIDLKCVELDGESVDYLLTHFPGMQGRLLQADYLRLDMNRVFKGNYRIIGNFPYNISSQIFFKILDDKDRIPEVVCMIQKEVAERIAEAPGSKTYGILSVLLQAWYDIEYCFTVGSGAFAPPPKVQSAVIRLTRNARTELGCDEKLFKMVVKTAFNQRRKTLRNALKPLLTQRLQSMATIPLHPQGTGEGSPETPSVGPSDLRAPLLTQRLQDLNTIPDIDAMLDLRAERLSVEDFILLTRFIEGR